MAGVLLDGQRDWRMVRHADGRREYKITHMIKCDATDGPAQALSTPGLPLPGSLWNFDGDVDLDAWCLPDAEVAPVLEGEPNRYFTITQTFSTVGQIGGAGGGGGPGGGGISPSGGSSGGGPASGGGQTRCFDIAIENPLLEPQQVSGGFIRFTEEATEDIFGFQLLSSSYEPLRGPQVEFDRVRPTLRVQQNVLNLEFTLLLSMINTVNENPIWGFGARQVKFANVSWERLYYGACFPYYRRVLEFEFNEDTFDRSVADEGTKVLRGHWDLDNEGHWILENIDGIAPNPNNPAHFEVYRDRNGNLGTVLLNGEGIPAGAIVGASGPEEEAGSIDVFYYFESDFLLLGVPVTF